MRRALVGAAVMVVILAGCSSSSAKKASAPPVSLAGKVNDHGTKKASGGSLDVDLYDFYFEPTFVQGPAGGKVTLHLSNEGKASHTFTSSQLGVDVTLKPGGKQDVAVTLPAASTVEFICRFHQSGGMRGAFAVQ
jgi:plastocyanin